MKLMSSPGKATWLTGCGGDDRRGQRKILRIEIHAHAMFRQIGDDIPRGGSGVGVEMVPFNVDLAQRRQVEQRINCREVIPVRPEVIERGQAPQRREVLNQIVRHVQFAQTGQAGDFAQISNATVVHNELLEFGQIRERLETLDAAVICQAQPVQVDGGFEAGQVRDAAPARIQVDQRCQISGC